MMRCNVTPDRGTNEMGGSNLKLSRDSAKFATLLGRKMNVCAFHAMKITQSTHDVKGLPKFNNVDSV